MSFCDRSPEPSIEPDNDGSETEAGAHLEPQDTRECEICQEVYTRDDMVLKLHCKHFLHRECVLRYSLALTVATSKFAKLPNRFLF
jgi:hypothetical protein